MTLTKCHTDVVVSNLFCRGAADWPIENLKLTPRFNNDEYFENLVWIEIITAFGRIAIGQSVGLVDNLLKDQLGADGQKYSSNMWSAVMSKALSSWLADLELMSKTNISLRYLDDYLVNNTDDVITINFDASLPHGQKEILSLCCDNSVKPVLIEFLSNGLKKQSHTKNKLDVPIPVFMRIGSSTVVMKDAWNLEQGDVVLIDTVYGGDQFQVLVRIGSSHFLKGSYGKRGGIKITSNSGEIKLEEIADLEKAEDLDTQISLKLDFDIGQTEIKYSELSDLKEGYIFDLGKQLSTGVTIRSGWHVVGRGELVDIGGGRLGVRVTEGNTILDDQI